MNVFDKFELFGQHLHNGQDYLKNHILTQFPVVHSDEEIYEWEGSEEYVWLVDPSVEVLQSFPWYYKPAIGQEPAIHAFPQVYKDSKKVRSYDTVRLVPTKEGDYKTVKSNYIACFYDIYNSKDKFDYFYINSPEDILEAQEKSTTDLFWAVPNNVIVRDTFKFNYKPDYWSIDNIHVFGNGSSDMMDGVCLIPRNYNFNKRELDYRFYANKKQIKVIASDPVPYEKFKVDSYSDYENALEHCQTEMFWAIPSDVEVAEDFNFDYHVSYQNKNVVQVFLNGEHRDGIVLLPRDKKVSKKEIEHRFYVSKNELDIVASYPKSFKKWTVNSYKDYMNACNEIKEDMFWMVYSDLNIRDDFNFDFYISHHDSFNRNIHHIFKNNMYYDGLALISKNLRISRKEFEYRFFANKKEHDIQATTPSLYDIVFISYNEPNADENFKKLVEQFPDRVIHRVHGIKGIHQAHIMAAKAAETEMFWVVDGDANIIDNFNFDYQIAHYDIDGKSTVHVWRSYNPINNLVYGYGGVKLLPTRLTKNMDVYSSDMTTSISNKFKGIEVMSNTTAFNTDPFSAWRSGFRECVKLASKTIHRQKEDETNFRLEAWCTRGADKPFGEYAIAGAIHGKKYGEKYADSPEDLRRINDFDWLEKEFKKSSVQLV